MLGIGWRPELAWMIHQRKDIQFVEILAEDFCQSEKPIDPLKLLMNRGTEVFIHGTTLNLGGSEEPSFDALQHLNRLAKTYRSPLVSEHLAFVQAGGIDSGHLLPIQRTYENLEIVVENISIAQNKLDVPLALENIATLFEWPDNELDEATYLAEIIAQTNVSILLDVANLYANSINHKFDIDAFLDRLPLQSVAYIHIAGGIFKGELYHDTHCHSIKNPVLKLLSNVCSRMQKIGRAPKVLLERDGLFAENFESELNGELDVIKLLALQAAQLG